MTTIIKIGNKTSRWIPSNEYYNSWKRMIVEIKKAEKKIKE